MKTLKQVKIGENAKVVKLHGEGAVKRRISIFNCVGFSNVGFPCVGLPCIG